MKSICIKTNDLSKIDYLLEELDEISMDKMYLSSYKFKIFQNVIIHYSGEYKKEFLEIVASKIANLIEKFYQDKIIKNDIKENYFYLEEEEQEAILRITKKIIESPECTLNCNKDILATIIYNYFIDNKTMSLEGFVKFRINEYRKMLSYIIELSVFNYLNLTV